MRLTQPSELLGHLPKGARLLALDLGEKTIGLALSDGLRVIATPLFTIRRGKFTDDANTLIGIIGEHKVGALVLGYPINMDGTEGPRCQSVRQFARNFEEKHPIPILLADERMSTMAVTRTMLDADLSRARRSELVDKLAASYILQGVLDALPRVEL
jgi:putative Holliday junction resolvase